MTRTLKLTLTLAALCALGACGSAPARTTETTSATVTHDGTGGETRSTSRDVQTTEADGRTQRRTVTTEQQTPPSQ